MHFTARTAGQQIDQLHFKLKMNLVDSFLKPSWITKVSFCAPRG